MAVPQVRDFPDGPNFNSGPKKLGSALPDLELVAANPTVNITGAGLTGGRVLVLNASFEPINVCTVRRAIVLILKEKAEMLDAGELVLRSEQLSLTRPSVIRLTTYVRIPYGALRRRITRRAVFARDDWSCQYCGRTGTLTMDHVVPRSKGGGTSWDNVVACCAGCNRRKGDRLPDQAGMKLRTTPSQPHAMIFIHVASPTIPTSWLPYVAK
ncbi:MAG: HNH endonuclease [Thermoleophilaceae bacterium]|nr:HNH endonuclease [Thermoleophilaceae bacterium]